jgi:hypothetical protein
MYKLNEVDVHLYTCTDDDGCCFIVSRCTLVLMMMYKLNEVEIGCCFSDNVEVEVVHLMI